MVCKIMFYRSNADKQIQFPKNFVCQSLLHNLFNNFWLVWHGTLHYMILWWSQFLTLAGDAHQTWHIIHSLSLQRYHQHHILKNLLFIIQRRVHTQCSLNQKYLCLRFFIFVLHCSHVLLYPKLSISWAIHSWITQFLDTPSSWLWTLASPHMLIDNLTSLVFKPDPAIISKQHGSV